MNAFTVDWSPPPGDQIKLGEGAALAGSGRVWSDWRPYRPGEREPYFPYVPGYTLLGVGDFSCANDVEGEKRYSTAVYRCDGFVAALIRAGFLGDEPSAIYEPGNTEANARAAVDCEFVLLPPFGHYGKFLMGSPENEEGHLEREGPQQAMQICRQFLIARTAVTQRVWQAVMGSNPAHFQNRHDGASSDSSRLPVEQVSWDEIMGAEGFVTRAGLNGLRLPSEGEWEFACRAGTQTPLCFGSGRTVTSEIVNFNGGNPCGGGPTSEWRHRTVEVASLPMNGFGLFEVHGNVWEWCGDAWVDTLAGIPADGSARENIGASDRVFRGGCWHDSAVDCRSAYRCGDSPGWRGDNLGFRPVQALSD